LITDQDRVWFYGELKKYGNLTGTLWLLSPEPPANSQLPIRTVEDIVLSEEFVQYVGDGFWWKSW